APATSHLYTLSLHVALPILIPPPAQLAPYVKYFGGYRMDPPIDLVCNEVDWGALILKKINIHVRRRSKSTPFFAFCIKIKIRGIAIISIVSTNLTLHRSNRNFF